MNPIENFFLNLEEPNRGCLLFLKEFILNLDENIHLGWAYGTPFFYYKKKSFCYFWFNKKTKQPYLSLAKGNLISHPELKSEGRKRFKVLYLYPNEDLPIKTIEEILREAISLY